MDVATKCMSRYSAEYIERNRTASGPPAQLGTAVHNSLEIYVKTVYMDGPNDGRKQPELKYLLDLFRMQFMVVFDSIDPTGDMYEDGVEMLTRWFERTDLSEVTVVSVEEKTPFQVNVQDSAGTNHQLPFNYIFDRLDRLDETTYRVVDYKTWRQALAPDDLMGKLQARAYGLACQIQFPHAEKIWVQFDQLRHERIGIVLTKADNANTWRYIKRWAKTILDTKPEDAAETINPDCKWCIRKATCKALAKNHAAGGIAGLGIPELIDRRGMIDSQMAGLQWAATELDEALKKAAEADDLTELTSDQFRVFWSRSSRRGIERVDVLENILGPQLFEQVGKKDVSITQLDKLLKKGNTTLSDEQKAQVKGLIVDKLGEPKLKTKPVNDIDKV
jgi:hypothetical protein